MPSALLWISSSLRLLSAHRFASTLEPLLLSSLLLVVIMHALAVSSQSHMRFLLATLHVVIYSAFVFNRGIHSLTQLTLTPDQLLFLMNFSQNVCSIKKLELEPDCTLYAQKAKPMGLSKSNIFVGIILILFEFGFNFGVYKLNLFILILNN